MHLLVLHAKALQSALYGLRTSCTLPALPHPSRQSPRTSRGLPYTDMLPAPPLKIEVSLALLCHLAPWLPVRNQFQRSDGVGLAFIRCITIVGRFGPAGGRGRLVEGGGTLGRVRQVTGVGDVVYLCSCQFLHPTLLVVAKTRACIESTWSVSTEKRYC